VVAPGFLQNPEVRRWLNGIEPIWTMLEFDSFNALHEEPSANNHAIRLEPNLTTTEISASSVTANALILLRRAAETGGLKLTVTGNGARLATERDTHAALCVSRDWRSGVAMGLWFERDGGSHSPTLGLVRASRITNPTEIGDRVG
jgi:hypothetical protein